MAEVMNFEEVCENIDNAAEEAVTVVPEKESFGKKAINAVKKAVNRVAHPQTKIGKAAQVAAIGAAAIVGYKTIDKLKAGKKAVPALESYDVTDEVEEDTDDFGFENETEQPEVTTEEF